MKKTRWLSVVIAVLLLLSACGGSDNEEISSGGSVDSDGHVTLDFWYALGGDSGKAVEELVSRFNASQSTITVSATYQGDYTSAMAKVYSAIAGNSTPNVVQVGGAPLLGSSGAIMSIDSFLASDSNYDINQIRPAFLEYNTVDGTLWSMPFNNSVPVLYYNKDLFEAVGLDADNPPQNVDELLAAAQKLTLDPDNTGSPTQWGLNARDDTHWFLSTLFIENGAQIVSADQSEVIYNSPEAVEMLQLWSDWVNEYKVMPVNQHAEAQSDFLAGKLGMLMGSSSILTSLQTGASFELGTVVFPAVGSTRSLPIGGGSLTIFKNNDTRITDAAWEFVKYMISKDSSIYLSTKTGYIPIYADALEWPEVQALIAETPVREAVFGSLNYVTSIPVFSALGNSDLALRKAIQEVELGASAPQEALDEAKVTVDQSIKSLTGATATP